MNCQTIDKWLGGEAPFKEEVDTLARQMPWWLLPAVMRLRNGADVDAEERKALLTRVAVGAPDLAQMSMAVNANLAVDLGRFYPIERPETPDTENTIEKFLSTYGHAEKGEDELLERLIFNPTPDYAQILAREEEQSTPRPDEAPAGSQDDLINSFIIKSKAAEGHFPSESSPVRPSAPPSPQSEVQKPAPTDDSMLSESLAKVYIRRHNYRKAHEIITHLNLNFPQKSIYFADQLRFLEKLIAIEERKSASTNENNN
ncbi:MAG: hypothetical protein NC301_02050 [Bacteroides sp.]|nr:hypothetical protein [Bacteroides sp.]MCM1379047.1 hypothetical protein [Bacteroides sp.]MCM1445745.1 hypothetical protein [Prevotella sp.]